MRSGRRGSEAAVCDYSQGNYLGSLALVIAGLDDPAILEAKACREALAMSEDLNLRNLVVASDSKQNDSKYYPMW